MKTIKEQFNSMKLIPIFEIEVISKRTGEIEYLIFDLSIKGNSFVAIHESLNTEQLENVKIAFVTSEIDEDFSLTENLEAIYNECLNAIVNSEFYDIS